MGMNPGVNVSAPARPDRGKLTGRHVQARPGTGAAIEHGTREDDGGDEDAHPNRRAGDSVGVGRHGARDRRAGIQERHAGMPHPAVGETLIEVASMRLREPFAIPPPPNDRPHGVSEEWKER